MTRLHYFVAVGVTRNKIPTLSVSRWAGSQSSPTMSKRFGREGPVSGQTGLRHSIRDSLHEEGRSQNEAREIRAERTRVNTEEVQATIGLPAILFNAMQLDSRPNRAP